MPEPHGPTPSPNSIAVPQKYTAEPALSLTDKTGMRKFNLFPQSKDIAEVPVEPPPPSTAILVRPLRPAIPAITFERRSFARLEARRLEQTTSSREPAVREPLAYPTAPPRPAGAARPSFQEVSPFEESLDPRQSAYQSRFASTPMQRPAMRRPANQSTDQRTDRRMPQNRPEEG